MFFPCGFLGGMVAVGVGNGIIKRSETKETAVKLTTKERRAYRCKITIQR